MYFLFLSSLSALLCQENAYKIILKSCYLQSLTSPDYEEDELSDTEVSQLLIRVNESVCFLVLQFVSIIKAIFTVVAKRRKPLFNHFLVLKFTVRN